MATMKAKRRIKKLYVHHISLVEKGANLRGIIYKAEKQPDLPEFNKTIEIRKTNDEEHMVYGIVYAPDEVDAHGDIATAEVIKDASERFMRAKNIDKIDRQHDLVNDNGFVAETWIVKSGDPMFPDDAGAWAVGIKVTNEETWKAIKKGDIGGLSMGAQGLVEDLEKELSMKDLMKQFVADLHKAFLEVKWSGSVGEADGDSSLKDDLTSIFKDVKTPEDAKTAIESMTKFNDSALAQAKELLKEHLEETVVPPKKDDDTDDDPADIAKAITLSMTESLKPLVESVDKISGRLDTLEKAGTGRHSGLPNGDGDGDGDDGYEGVNWVGAPN